jgi:hypothetical protein
MPLRFQRRMRLTVRLRHIRVQSSALHVSHLNTSWLPKEADSVKLE